jgi:hypothetical protein
MRKLVIIGLLLLTAGFFGVATTFNIIVSHAMAQEYDKYIVLIANIQPTITNINVEQVYSKASLSAQ